jgi:hypothetical protein
LWNPSEYDTCSKALHDSYSVVGVDGKTYPTWHPPVDPSGCTFGHEHGKDPSGSDLYADIGPIPFGLANEALMAFEGYQPRHEDHVGHKVEWENDLAFTPNRPGGVARTCDALIKLHQGTHSADAFTNNVHEFVYHLKCDDGAEIHLTMLAPIGRGGQFLEKCTSAAVLVGAPNPPDSPGGVDTRQISTRHCVDRHIVGDRRQAGVSYVKGIGETWPVSVAALRADGSKIAVVAVYANIGNPSRFYDPALPNGLARSVNLCYEDAPSGDGRTMGPCAEVRALGPTVLSPNDPRSPFTGSRRTVRWNQIGLSNTNGAQVYYTDPFGRAGRETPFPGSIMQRFTAMSNGGLLVSARGSFGGDYTAPGVHAPN